MIFFTSTLTSGSLVLNTVDGAEQISIQPQTGSSCTVEGGIDFKQMASSPITLSAGESLTLSSRNVSNPIDALTITWVSGVISIVIGF